MLAARIAIQAKSFISIAITKAISSVAALAAMKAAAGASHAAKEAIEEARWRAKPQFCKRCGAKMLHRGIGCGKCGEAAPFYGSSKGGSDPFYISAQSLSGSGTGQEKLLISSASLKIHEEISRGAFSRVVRATLPR